MNTKLHAVTDAEGRPIRFFMTAGEVSDYTGDSTACSVTFRVESAQAAPPGKVDTAFLVEQAFATKRDAAKLHFDGYWLSGLGSGSPYCRDFGNAYP